ncbi:MAG TPA: SDR family NAD(P)-dependent oxidoreductase [Sandaracinaceae bacterium LLY-WYZ-13_1]|nr:SDR family NAD(P)-dependent oxidoreductase [Sandaracinaceae bacterium LLY-WYZ-13_1]
MSLVAWIRGRRGASGFGYASTAEEVTAGIDLRGKTILVTGVNSGLGRESARVLSLRGATILGAARTRAKARAACEALPGEAVPLECELSEPRSVRACVAEARAHAPLDVVLCNAGIMALPERTIVHGQELQFLTNHVGHFILVTSLLDALSDDARVVMLSSGAHAWAPPGGIQLDDPTFERGYSPNQAYGQSKLANLLFAKELARRFEGTDKTANAVHPGVIATNLGRHMPWYARVLFPIAAALAFKSIPQGAATQCYVATHPSLADVRGEYFADCNTAKSSRHSRDPELAKRLWDLTEAIVADLAPDGDGVSASTRS